MINQQQHLSNYVIDQLFVFVLIIFVFVNQRNYLVLLFVNEYQNLEYYV